MKERDACAGFVTSACSLSCWPSSFWPAILSSWGGSFLFSGPIVTIRWCGCSWHSSLAAIWKSFSRTLGNYSEETCDERIGGSAGGRMRLDLTNGRKLYGPIHLALQHLVRQSMGQL